jgi:hypothetical protein
MKDDLETWLHFLSNYYGATMILDQHWSSNSDLELFTDSAAKVPELLKFKAT